MQFSKCIFGMRTVFLHKFLTFKDELHRFYTSKVVNKFQPEHFKSKFEGVLLQLPVCFNIDIRSPNYWGEKKTQETIDKLFYNER